ncbi:MAG TPA: class I SAM-dependent methyltransferase [Candidatus Polarisedimenticolaceae bacterium]|nr:class I SAM-dependent methyltransferase [Candidatus Polarisedimenticolaceae bacterium]
MLLVKNKLARQVFGLLETANLLSLKLLFHNRSALRTYPGAVFREYMRLARRGKWVSMGVLELFPEVQQTRIVLEHMAGHGIYTPLDELAYLALITKALEPRSIFEIGTFRGRTALNFALNSPADCRVFTIDLPPEGREQLSRDLGAADRGIVRASDTGVDYRGKDVATKIEQLFGDSNAFDFSPYFGQIDLVFVDGAHDYRSVRNDSANARRMIRAGGVIVWHDFANYGDYNDVTRAVLDLFPPSRIVQIENSQLAVYRS